MNRFQNKIAVVTGGAEGIGAATARRLAAEGAKVYVLDIQEPDDSSLVYLPCDVRDYAQIQAAVARVREEAGRIDCLFANAGVHLLATLEEATLEDFENVLAINVKGVFYTLKAVMPVMREQRGGSVVLMGSDQAFIGKPRSSVYGLTKGATSQLAKSTALDYAEYGVRVNCICPGTIETPLVDRLVRRIGELTGQDEAAIVQSFHDGQPLGRMGKAEEIATVVCFLLSDENSFMTGSLIASDGGYVAQ
ncbi:MAG: SDR family oxidoreductase [Verrucomicrobiota bacterium]